MRKGTTSSKKKSVGFESEGETIRALRREIEIEAALERVRAASMAMHKSEELVEVVRTLDKEIIGLGIDINGTQILTDFTKEGLITWFASEGQAYLERIFVPFVKLPLLNRLQQARKKNLGFYQEKFSKTEKNRFIRWLYKHTGYGNFTTEERRKFVISASGWARATVLTRNSALTFQHFDLRDFTNEEVGIFKRFAKVFEQSYTRFLDLQKAEAQAREAQIEAALERVRSRSIAMRKSAEIAEIAAKIFSELQQLDLVLNRVLIWTFNDTEKYTTWWSSNPEVESTADSYRIDYNSHPVFMNFLKAWRQRKPIHLYTLSGNNKKTWEDHLFEHTEMSRLPKAVRKGMREEGTLYTVNVVSDYGLMMSGSFEPLSEYSIDIIQRFARVFQQSYTRYLDVQKAETQAREAQIEAALERIRSRALAMHHSDEIEDVVYVMKEQMSLLGQPGLHASIIHLWPKDSDCIESWSAYDYKQGRKRKSSFLRSTVPKGTSRLLKRMEKFYASAEQEGTIVASHEELKEWYKVRLKLFPETRKIGKAPKIMYYRMSKFSEGYLLLVSNEPAGEETIRLQNRAAKVFDLAYRRYVDLKNAEAQAREAQIEAALEKVRSRSLALQKSDELREVVAVLLQQLQIIGIDAFMSMIVLLNRKTEEYDVIMSSDVQSVLPKIYRVPNFRDIFRKRFIESFYEGKPYKVFEFGGKLKKDFDKLFFKVTDFSKLPARSKKMMQSLERCSLSCAYMSHGCIEAIGDQPLSVQDANTLQRFARVFEQAYTRFLDIKNAEAQAREAQIEAALERVRSKAMAMHNSADLPSAASVVFTELRALGLNPFRSGISLHSREHREILLYTATQSKRGDELSVVGTAVLENHPVLTKIYDNWLIGEDYYPSLQGKLLKSYYKQIAPTFKVPKEQSEIEQYGYFIPFTQGLLYGWSTQPVDESQKQILKRFASVVDLTFKRYFDLQKAEEQARESNIEAALERVRAKAMGMHNTADLSTAASTVFSELRKLGIEPIRSGVGHLHKESPMTELYAATSSVNGDELSLVGQINLVGHPVLEKIYDSWINEKDYFPELDGSQLKVYYKLLAKDIPIPVSDFRKDDKQYGHFIYAPIGFLYVWSEEKHDDEQIRILKRFASIIDLTFRRYFELQKSEANAKEAIKRSVLDRIRADIASMRSVTDLDRITPLIWNELTTLGIPFVRCGVFIMDESQELIHTFLSTPDGKAIAAFHLPYEVAGKTRLILENWQMNKAYIDHWTDSDFLDFANMLVGQHIIESSDQYLSTVPHGGVHLHCLPFLQGMLYVGSSTQRLSDEDISLIQSIADAFSTAYARYEDFNKLEAAKHQVENTLTDLKQAQQQLVQSEKMASLGELTAGIAHEIQNPLNFVNNFSEVSTELLEEMKSELDSGNWQPATELANDIMTNLEKILHHGKRADGIVKGMLQHSRGSTGQRESTDINNLCDEYLRLAFHGYRAKDKSFNSKFETELDGTLPKVNVVPQDIGRVVLNLINNAFYAVSVRAQGLSPRTYQPLVIVATRNLGDKIEIRVRDNGGGIPESVREKIFQPFYTTKPTGQGTGLGLSLSYDIIKSHKGEIRFESVDGEGTEFIINIPIA